MKKNIKFIIIGLIIALAIGFIFYVFRDTSYDDTNKLVISCGKNRHSYSIITSDKISFAENDDSCKMNIEVRNVDRNFIKLKTSSYFYQKDSNDEIINETISRDIYVTPNEKLVLYSKDKNIKFEFEYK